MRALLVPGDLVCQWAGLPEGSDHRQILRMFINTIVWGVVGVAVALALAA